MAPVPNRVDHDRKLDWAKILRFIDNEVIKFENAPSFIRQPAMLELNQTQHEGHIKIVQVTLLSIPFSETGQVIQVFTLFGPQRQTTRKQIFIRQQIVEVPDMVLQADE